MTSRGTNYIPMNKNSFIIEKKKEKNEKLNFLIFWSKNVYAMDNRVGQVYKNVFFIIWQKRDAYTTPVPRSVLRSLIKEHKGETR